MKPAATNKGLRLHERLCFDLDAGQVLDAERRYVILRADVLMGAFDGLEPAARMRALEALGASVTRNGADSVRAYLAELGPGALLEAMVAGSASLGWGRWSFRDEGQRLWLEVRNSPFAAGTRFAQRPSCHAITGMLGAVAGALWGLQSVDASELDCACTHVGTSDRCLFLAQCLPPP